ncbi:MAG: hypothetical protein MJ240_04980 [Kiritimatiellae bacterium]|nr:hypothetical protein [Kiritimatiellia bacterium]
MKNRWAIALGFLGAILIGALLLALPIASPSHTWRPFGDALFTACSAVCITGLSVIEPGTDLSLFGQIVLLVLVELGCVGIMTLGTFFLVVIGQRLSLASEFSLVGAYGTRGVKGLRGLIVWVIVSTMVIEALATMLLWWQFTRGAASWEVAYHDTTAWYRAFFYAVMAFANAGFSLDPGSLAVFQSRPGVLLTMAAEVVLGGVGFFVIYNVCTIQFWRRNLVKRGRLSLHSRVVIYTTAFFFLVTALVFWLAERNHALAGLDFLDKIVVSVFQAVAPRSCGFTVVPMENVLDATRFINEILMFIGAAPGSAGGGIKVTTVVVFLLTIGAIYHGRHETVIFRRTVPLEVVRESFVIFFFVVALIATSMTILLFTEVDEPALTFENLLFETVSAVTTTGLSCGNTTQLLSPVGRVVIMMCMFFGRLGAITVVLLIGGRDEVISSIKYPKEELVVG